MFLYYDRIKPFNIYKGIPFVPTQKGVDNCGNYQESAKGMYAY